jgi:hypothetical protein
MRGTTTKILAGITISLLWISAAGAAACVVLQQNPQTTYEPGLHLLVDPDSIVESNGVTVILNQPVKHPEPVVVSSWLPYRFATAWGNVIREPNGLYRMWYLDMIISPHDHAKRKVWGDESDYGYHPQGPGDFPDVDIQFICYAESWDGIKWTKPALGVVEFEGSTANNIVASGRAAAKQFAGAITNMDGCTVVRDDGDPDPNRRYKMLAYWETVHRYDNRHNGLHRPEEDIKRFNNKNIRGHYISCSPDGIHFGDLEPSGLPKVGIDRNLIMRDYKRNQWRVNMRPDIPKNEFSSFVRGAGILTGTDFKTWSPLEAVLAPDEGDQFGGIQDFEAFIPFNYGEEDLGYLNVNNMRGKRFAPYLTCQGRDGKWKRVFRDQPAIVCGSPGSFDRAGVSPLQNEPIIVGDELYIYYSAFSRINNHPAGARSIGLAKMRRDAFVGAAAGVIAPKSNFDLSGEATFTTWPLKVTGPRLAVNFEKFNDSSRLQIELRDENKNPIPGYTLDDCQPITTDGIRVPVVWKEGKDLSALMGKEVLIRVSFVNGAVYAFKFYAP